MSFLYLFVSFFFFNDTATTEIYTYGHTLSLHDALPICHRAGTLCRRAACRAGNTAKTCRDGGFTGGRLPEPVGGGCGRSHRRARADRFHPARTGGPPGTRPAPSGPARHAGRDRKSGVSGKSGSVRVGLGERRGRK